MNLLFLGGTNFVGRHAAEAAVAQGHAVTLFHRGSKGPGIVAGAAEIFGDREGPLDVLASRDWDAVIDTCGYVPRVIRNSVEALKDRSGRYLFVSTISVYKETEDGGLELQRAEPLETEEVTGETYGPLKVECEDAVLEGFPDALIVRPGIIAGPYDPTNRFTHWAARCAEGGELLVPDVKAQPIEVIDARDLGAFMVEALEKKLAGVFDVAGEQTTFGEMIETCASLNPTSKPCWASEEFLEEHGVQFWVDLPLALPSSESVGLFRVDSWQAVQSGLRRRPLTETARDTADWHPANATAGPARHGISRERELELLAALHTA